MSFQPCRRSYAAGKLINHYYSTLTHPVYAKFGLLIILIGLVELAVLVKLGMEIGLLQTILFQLGIGFVGAWIARLYGIRIWLRIQGELAAGRMPAEQMIDALLIFVAGIIMLTPGLLTDVLALALLLPGSRTVFKRWLRKRFDRMRGSQQTGLTVLLD